MCGRLRIAGGRRTHRQWNPLEGSTHSGNREGKSDMYIGNEQNFQFSGPACEILVDLFRLKIYKWLELQAKYMNTAAFRICMHGRLIIADGRRAHQ